MQKRSTYYKNVQIANDTMYYIYEYIDSDINIDELANSFNISKFHFHKIFKEVMGLNIYETIKSIRLQKASSLLLTNKYSTITEIAKMCGYSSQTSFIRTFKQRFNQTPKEWRNGGYKVYSNNILKNSDFTYYSNKDFNFIEPQIVKVKPRKTYYIRQKGYLKDEVTRVWQKMQAWVYTNAIEDYEEIAVYHDNPTITPHSECFYVAGVIPKELKNLENTNLPHFYTPEALYATFETKGKLGDILKFIQWAYHVWLPNSGFETTTNPSYSIFKKNHFLEKDGEFEATYYLPIQYI
ncbi:AraC family transcriptional regulator [Halarcobacter ebronensis]|uniref:AraC family transcriptional regulator n=1 Tax=Halarcobacter ebronensis TaxID=1462615 RepID=A0A4Q1B0C5_9BACT|nr:helix-turn-helix domain-containing protein [Halarcobacter ebronensis]QKF80642.1 transcriptional regulator, AraC family (GyrI domain) [Halarcobacter ebronensis]RXK08443.1 AraC family transcriptional regulator [Halarcobacter ebronensis]